MIERLFIFGKAQVSSFIGGIVDYLLMILFTEFFHLHYTLSIAIDGIAGAIVNFSLTKAGPLVHKPSYHRPDGFPGFQLHTSTTLGF